MVTCTCGLLEAFTAIVLYNLAMTPGMKESMVVKIAYHASDLYADAMKLMQLPSLRDLWPRVGAWRIFVFLLKKLNIFVLTM